MVLQYFLSGSTKISIDAYEAVFLDQDFLICMQSWAAMFQRTIRHQFSFVMQ